MKKVLTSFVIVSALVLAVSCGNNNGKKQAQQAATEQVDSTSCADSCCVKSDSTATKGACSQEGSCSKESCCSKTK